MLSSASFIHPVDKGKVSLIITPSDMHCCYQPKRLKEKQSMPSYKQLLVVLLLGEYFPLGTLILKNKNEQKVYVQGLFQSDMLNEQ